MADFGGRNRTVALLVLGGILVVSGVTLGTTEGRLILGKLNDAGAANTSLTTRSAGQAFRVVQAGAGAAVQGTANGPAGVGGTFSSATGTGLAADVGGPAGYALDATHRSEIAGSGAAIHAAGRYNAGIRAESFAGSAVIATATGGAQAIVADAPFRTAIKASGPGGGDVVDCDALFCAGTESTGAIGVIAGTATTDGTGVYAVDQTADQSGFAVVADGDAIVDGSLSVTGACLGCGSLVVARNGSEVAIRQGDIVTLLGLEAADDGSTVIVVAPAVEGQDVVGFVDRAISRVDGPARSTTVAGGWRIGAPDVAPGDMLRLAIGGVLTLDRPLDGVAGGARLTAGGTPGRAVASSGDAEQHVGTYLGARPDGKGVVLVDLD